MASYHTSPGDTDGCAFFDDVSLCLFRLLDERYPIELLALRALDEDDVLDALTPLIQRLLFRDLGLRAATFEDEYPGLNIDQPRDLAAYLMRESLRHVDWTGLARAVSLGADPDDCDLVLFGVVDE
jgi:hypothetical protein